MQSKASPPNHSSSFESQTSAGFSSLRARFSNLFGLLVASLALIGLAQKSAAEIIPDGCKFNGIFIALVVDKQTAHVGDTLFYSLVIGNAPFPACRAEGIVTSIITPDGVTHPMTLKRTVLNPGESDTYDNVVSYVLRSQDIKN